MVAYHRRKRIIHKHEFTSTFIFLHENHSSADGLADEVMATIAPTNLGDLLEGARTSVLNAPFIIDEEIQGSSTSDSDGLGCESRWFMTMDPIGTDDTATLLGWKQLSCSMLKVGQIIEWEAGLVGRENVFVLGFGMGFAVGAAYVLQMDDPIGGLLGVYPLMPFHGDLKSLALCGETTTPREQMRRPYAMKMGEKEGDECSDGELLSGFSTPTICCSGDDDSVTSEAMLKRVAGFFSHLVSRGEPPVNKRVYEHADCSTPVILVHGADDDVIHLSYAKEALETFRKLGFDASLRVIDGQDHELSHEMIGILLNEFMMRDLGNAQLRESIGGHLLGGWL